MHLSFLRKTFVREVFNLRHIAKLEHLLKQFDITNQQQRITNNNLVEKNTQLKEALHEFKTIRESLKIDLDNAVYSQQKEKTQFENIISLLENEIKIYQAKIQHLKEIYENEV